MKQHSDGAAVSLTALVTVAAPISWGTTYITVSELLPPDRPISVAASRVLPAGLALVAIGLARARWHPRGREWLVVALLGVFNFALFFPLLVVAIYRLPGGVAASFGGLQPLLVALIAALIRGERPSGRTLAVGVVAAVGVGLVVVRPGAAFDLVGIGAAVAANVSFAVGVVLTKSIGMREHRIAATGWQLLLASVVIVPLAILTEGPPPTFTAASVTGFGYLSLVATGAAFAVWFRGIERLPTAAPPLLGLAAPVTGAALGWLLLGEDLSSLQIVGFSLTIVAITYGATAGARPPRPLSTPARGRCVSARPGPVAAPATLRTWPSRLATSRSSPPRPVSGRRS